MKKVFVIFLALIMIFSLASCGKEVDLLDSVLEKGKIVIATEGDWAPWTYHDDNDNLTGFDVELGRLIAEGLGVEVEFKETAWDSILAGIDSKRFDIACNGVGNTKERAKKYYFSKPYVYMGPVLVVRSDNEDIKAFEDLRGKITANSIGSTYENIGVKYGATVQAVDTLADTINLLLEGRIDATINAAGSIIDYLGEHPDAKIKIVAESKAEEDVEKCCIPLRKNKSSKKMLEKIDEIIDSLRESGELSKLSIKYFGSDFTKGE